MKIYLSLVVAALFVGAPLSIQARQSAPRTGSMPLRAPSVSPMRGTAWGDTADYPPFGKLDKKGRGSLTRSDIPGDSESLRDLRMHFREADRDHNGRLSPVEYNTFLAAKTQSPEDAGGG